VSTTLYQPSLKPTPTCKEGKNYQCLPVAKFWPRPCLATASRQKQQDVSRGSLCKRPDKGQQLLDGRLLRRQLAANQCTIFWPEESVAKVAQVAETCQGFFFKPNQWSAAHPLEALQLVLSRQSLPNSQKYSTKEKIS
jgi:hypothetical protein